MAQDTLAVIPARGGSKGMHRKNLAMLNGRPLVAYAIGSARTATLVNRMIVSTDDPEIAEIAARCGAEVPFDRPAHLAADDVHAVAVVLHTLDFLEQTESYVPDVVVMLLPTAPLRCADHVDCAISLFRESRATAVVSVVEYEKQLAHFRHLRDGCLEPVVELKTPNAQRQDCEPLYVLNGAVYVAAPRTIRRHGSFHVPGARPYVMPREASVDINDRADLRFAEYLLSAGAPA